MEEGSSKRQWTQANLSGNKDIPFVYPPHERNNSQAGKMCHWQEKQAGNQDNNAQGNKQHNEWGKPLMLSSWPNWIYTICWWMMVHPGMASFWWSSHGWAHRCISNTSHVPTHLLHYIHLHAHLILAILLLPWLPSTKPMPSLLQALRNLPLTCKKE